MSSTNEPQCFSNEISGNECSQNISAVEIKHGLCFCENDSSTLHHSASKHTTQRQSYYAAISSSSSYLVGGERFTCNNFTSSLPTPAHSIRGTNAIKIEECSIGSRRKTTSIDFRGGKPEPKIYAFDELREIQNSSLGTEMSIIKPTTDTLFPLIPSKQQRHFNVVFLWEDLEYKLLNVYHIEYFKYFKCLVEHALYEATIRITNKYRLEEAKNDLLAIDNGGAQSCAAPRTGNSNNCRRRTFRKSLRELQLEVIDISNLEEFKYWRHIEIRMAKELYHREEVFWQTMDLINQMQALRTYCLL